jgi:hypothetical protein
MTCQRIEGSESSSHCMTGLSVFGACRFGRLIAIVGPFFRFDHKTLLVTVNIEPREPRHERASVDAISEMPCI